MVQTIIDAKREVHLAFLARRAQDMHGDRDAVSTTGPMWSEAFLATKDAFVT